ncbi:MAG: hypothetical protein IH989_01370 [Planctomycetes bacterium]|nr:hypothetical protein [Planctomycetota bacterium]
MRELADGAQLEGSLHHLVRRILELAERHTADASVARPGKLYLTPLERAGYSGRSHLFVLGMDESRFPGGGAEDPILLDDERAAVSGALTLMRHRPGERVWHLVRALGMCPGKVTLVAHTLGYELRCARPTTSDMGYTRDLGHGGVRLLLDTTRGLPSGVMVTLQAGNLVPMSFEEMVDPETNRTRIRKVDLASYTYEVARAYMIRLEKHDFESATMLAALASEAKMTPHEFRQRYESVVKSVNPVPSGHPAPASDICAVHPGERVGTT